VDAVSGIGAACPFFAQPIMLQLVLCTAMLQLEIRSEFT